LVWSFPAFSSPTSPLSPTTTAGTSPATATSVPQTTTIRPRVPWGTPTDLPRGGLTKRRGWCSTIRHCATLRSLADLSRAIPRAMWTAWICMPTTSPGNAPEQPHTGGEW